MKYESSSTIKKINELIEFGSFSDALVLLEELIDKHPTVRSLRLFKGILEKKNGGESDKRIRYINEIRPEDFCLCLNVTYRELSRIEQLFAIWVAMYRNSSSQAVMVDLKIFFDVLSEKECSEVESLIRKSNLSSIFKSIQIINLNIPSEYNFYKRDVDGSVDINDFPYGYKSGPNFQFFRLLGSSCLVNYKYVLVTESDCYPTCVDWLSKILFEISSKKEFWVLGSPFRGRSKIGPDIALHINGVAVYSIGEVGFKELLELWEFQLKNSISTYPNVAYDWSLEAYFGKLISVENWNNMTSVDIQNYIKYRKMFVYSNTIVNLAGESERSGSGRYNYAQLDSYFPGIAMVHGDYYLEDCKKYAKSLFNLQS